MSLPCAGLLCTLGVPIHHPRGSTKLQFQVDSPCTANTCHERVRATLCPPPGLPPLFYFLCSGHGFSADRVPSQLSVSQQHTSKNAAFPAKAERSGTLPPRTEIIGEHQCSCFDDPMVYRLTVNLYGSGVGLVFARPF